MDPLSFSNKSSGSGQLFTCPFDNGWCAYLVANGFSGPLDGQLGLTDLPKYPGYLLFSPEAPTIDGNAFVKNVYSFAGGLTQYQSGSFIWLTDPDVQLTSENALQLMLNLSGQWFAVLQPMNYNFGNNFATFFISNNGTQVSIDTTENSIRLTCQPGVSNFTFTSNNLSSSTQIMSGLEIPLTGKGRGRIRFTLGLNYASDFTGFDISNKYFFLDQQNSNQLTEFSYQLVVPGSLNELVLLQASIYPCDLMNATGTNTYFAFLGQTYNTATQVKAITTLSTYYLTSFGYVVSLAPYVNFITDNDSLNYPTKDSAMVVLSERSPNDPADTWYMLFQGGFALTLDISYQQNIESNGQMQLMCGLASTESISFTPQFIDHNGIITGQADWLYYAAKQNAFAPQFPVVATQNIVGSNTRQQWLAKSWVSAWAGVVMANIAKTPIVYHAQPQGSSLFSPTSDGGSPLFNHFTSGSGVLSMAKETVFFPLLPYGNASSTSTDQINFSLFEKQIINPSRKAIIAKIVHDEKIPASPTIFSALAHAATDGIHSTSPQGFYINVNQQDGIWNVMQLASNQFMTSKGILSNIFNLQFTPASPTVQSALQSNQLFLVISYNKKLDDGTYVLSNFNNEMEIEEWPFNLDVPNAPVNGIYNNVIIFKFCHGKLIDKVQNIQGWNMPDIFNDPTENGLPNVSMWLQQYIQNGMDKFSVQHDQDYYKFYSIATNDNWQGIIALGVDISVQDFPAELQGLLAGIDLQRFNAHHFGIDLSIVNNDGGTVSMQPTSSLFGLIDYEDQTFASLGSDPETYQKQAPINASVDYDFTVLKLKVGFVNSKIYNYNSNLALTVNKLFGEQVDAANRNNLLILTGTYENHNGVPSYTFINTGDSILNLKNNAIITDIEILKASFVTKVPQDGSGNNSVEAQFAFWGFVNYNNLSGFDLFSFGAETGDKSADYSGLSYASLYIDLSFLLNTPTTKTFAFDISHMAFDIGQSTPRKDSLYSHFPLQLAGITNGDNNNTPVSQGYLNVSIPTLKQQQGISGAWYGLVFNLNMGTLGALASSAGFSSTFMVAWAVGAKGAWAGIKLPGVNPQAPSFSLQGILKLDIGSILLEQATGTANVAYLMKINNIALKLFSLSFPSGGNISFMLFGNPGVDAQPESLGWYGAYVKNN